MHFVIILAFVPAIALATCRDADDRWRSPHECNFFASKEPKSYFRLRLVQAPPNSTIDLNYTLPISKHLMYKLLKITTRDERTSVM